MALMGPVLSNKLPQYSSKKLSNNSALSDILVVCLSLLNFELKFMPPGDDMTKVAKPTTLIQTKIMRFRELQRNKYWYRGDTSHFWLSQRTKLSFIPLPGMNEFILYTCCVSGMISSINSHFIPLSLEHEIIAKVNPVTKPVWSYTRLWMYQSLNASPNVQTSAAKHEYYIYRKRHR